MLDVLNENLIHEGKNQLLLIMTVRGNVFFVFNGAYGQELVSYMLCLMMVIQFI